MALFSLCKNFSLSHPLKVIYSEFHTLRRLENFSFIKRNSTGITPKRNFFWIFKRRSKREIRAKDQPPNSYELIYRNGSDNYFLTGQYLSFFSSVTITLVALYKYSDNTTYTEVVDTDNQMTRPVGNELLGVYAAFIGTVALLYLLTARMPMRIYYHPQSQRYLMYFYGPIPGQIKKQVVNVNDIRPASSKSLFYSETMYQHRSGQRLILVENYFRHPADLYIMLGVQKDPNVKGYEKFKNN